MPAESGMKSVPFIVKMRKRSIVRIKRLTRPVRTRRTTSRRMNSRRTTSRRTHDKQEDEASEIEASNMEYVVFVHRHWK